MIDGFCQFAIFFRNGVPRIVRRKPHLHRIPHIGPLGVMIHFLGSQCHAGHERKSFAEIAEFEFAVERIAGFCPVHGAGFRRSSVNKSESCQWIPAGTDAVFYALMGSASSAFPLSTLNNEYRMQKLGDKSFRTMALY